MVRGRGGARPQGWCRRHRAAFQQRLSVHSIPKFGDKRPRGRVWWLLRGRTELLIEVIRAIRDKVGDGLFLMVKLSAVERDNAIFRWRKRGNTLEESAQIAQWAETAGADAIHVSTGSIFPHPRNPAGAFPIKTAQRTYGTILASGNRTLLNYLLFRYLPQLFLWFGSRVRGISCRTVRSFPSVLK